MNQEYVDTVRLLLAVAPAVPLRAIATDLKSIKSAISAMGHRADLPTTKSGDEVKLIIDGNGVRVTWKSTSSFEEPCYP